MRRDVDQLAEPAGVDGDPALRRLVREVDREHDGQPQVTARDGEREVAREVAGVGDDEHRVRRGPDKQLPEGHVARGLVVQRSCAGQVHEPGVGPVHGDRDALQRDGGPGGIGGLDEPPARAGDERGLADVGAADEGDDGSVGASGDGGVSRRGVAARWRVIARSPRPRECEHADRVCPGLGGDEAGDGRRQRQPRPAKLHHTGPPSGVRAVTTTTTPGRRPSRSSSSRAVSSTETTRRRQPSGSGRGKRAAARWGTYSGAAWTLHVSIQGYRGPRR